MVELKGSHAFKQAVNRLENQIECCIRLVKGSPKPLWCAVLGDAMGQGRTPKEALADLLERLERE